MQSENKVCLNCQTSFTIEPDDFGFYEKMQVPLSTQCPECRLKRRLAFRNGKSLFRRKDDNDGKEIFSSYPPVGDFKVYDHEYWKSDAWDPMQYARDYDFSRPFFDQYRELLRDVPRPSKSVQGMVNSEYCDQAGFFKNSYLCFDGDKMEESAYTTACTNCKNTFDCTLCFNNELCYECVSVNGSYRTFFSQNCENCTDVWYSKNCIGCTNCYGCINLRDKTNYIFNKPCTKEEFEKKIKEMQPPPADFFLQFPVKSYHGFRTVNSSGDYLRNTKNVHAGYIVDDAEDAKYVYRLYLGAKDSYDYSVWGNGSSRMYECLTCGDQCYNMKFCFESWPGSRNLEYCCFCRSSSDCFGCVSVKKAQYCILNKQYSKEEYESLLVKIK